MRKVIVFCLILVFVNVGLAANHGGNSAGGEGKKQLYVPENVALLAKDKNKIPPKAEQVQEYQRSLADDSLLDVLFQQHMNATERGVDYLFYRLKGNIIQFKTYKIK